MEARAALGLGQRVDGRTDSRLVRVGAWRHAPALTPRKLLASIGADASFTDFYRAVALSHNGTTLAFVAEQAGQARLFIRKLDQLQATALVGTEGASMPFFSPDGQWIAFFASGKLKKASVAGGAAVTLCDAPQGRGGTWADEDTIIFTPTGDAALMRVSPAGGTPSAFGKVGEGAGRQAWPQALPGGKGVLYTENSSGAWDSANLVIAPLAGGAPMVVVRGGTLRATKAEWTSPAFSPDGRKLALAISDGKQRNTWVYEWTLDTLTQLTFDASRDGTPVWAPDGRRIAFSSDRAKPGTLNLYWVNADGTGEVTRLTDSPDSQLAPSWHPGGKFLAFHDNRGATKWDLMILPMQADAVSGLSPGKPTVFLSTPAAEATPMFSPDGRWIAYVSNETGGGYEVYVRPFPGPGGKWRISTEGGLFPRWSATSHELLFLSQGKVMAASYAVVGESVRAERPEIWSPTGFRSMAGAYPYDLHPDGKRLAIMADTGEGKGVTHDKAVFFFNFGDYLKKIAPVTKP